MCTLHTTIVSALIKLKSKCHVCVSEENVCVPACIATGEWGVPPSGGGEGSPHQTTQVRGGGETVGGSYWKPVLPLRHA